MIGGQGRLDRRRPPPLPHALAPNSRIVGNRNSATAAANTSLNITSAPFTVGRRKLPGELRLATSAVVR
jgi:hypothetical protein